MFKKVLFFALIGLFCATNLFAQNTKGTITGTVLDPNGAVVPNAKITLTDTNRGFSQNVNSNDEGAFRFVSLEPSIYQVKVEMSGFAETLIEKIAVRVGEKADVTATLRVNVQETVTIDESNNYRSLQTEDTKLSRTFSAEELNDLPVQASGQGRNFYAQARTAPGVQFSVQAHAPFSVSGNRPRSNNYLVDSVDNTDANTGLISGRGVTEQIVSQEAVQSFEILTHNFKAEYGRNSGAIVNLVTKSGTNSIRGSAYWYHNNSALSARNFFQGEKPGNRSNLAGFTVGAPIVKNRLWVFGQFETYRLRGTNPSLYQGLTAAEKASANPSVAALVALYPTIPSNTNRFLTLGVPSSTDQLTYLIRADWQITDRQRLMFRGADTKSERQSFGVGNILDSSAPGTRRTAGATLQHTWTPTAYLVNEFRLGFNRQIESDDVENSTPSFLGNQSINGQVGLLRVTGLSSLGIPTFLQQSLFQNNATISNETTWVRQNHVFKFGGSFRSIQVNGGNLDSTFRGSLTFNSIATFLAATPASYTRNVGDPRLGLRRKEIGAYLQDDWKITPNLTLNLGLRYEIFTAPREADNKLNQAFLLDTDKNNFAPRFGFAWNLLPKTVLRGGYGIFYNVVETTFLGLTRFNPPFIRSFTAVNPTFPNLFAQAQAGLPSGLVIPNQETSTPYAQHLTFGVERELFNPQSTLNVSYVGTLGRKLSRTRRPNGGEQLAQALRPDTTVGVVNVLETSANSDYQSLQVAFTQRFNANLQIRAAYTYSKFLDEVSDIATSNTNLDRRLIPFDESRTFLDRAVSDFDIPHTLTFTYLYRVPFFRNNDLAGKLLGGWTVSGITTLRSGLPFTLFTGTNTPLGNNNQRPNDIAGSLVLNPATGQAIAFAPGFTALSVRPATGVFGNLGRNTERGDAYFETNISLQKDFRFSERLRAQIRGEIFNVFNTTNFNAIDNVMTSPTFGRYTSAFDPRRAQVAVRLVF